MQRLAFQQDLEWVVLHPAKQPPVVEVRPLSHLQTKVFCSIIWTLLLKESSVKLYMADSFWRIMVQELQVLVFIGGHVQIPSSVTGARGDVLQMISISK